MVLYTACIYSSRGATHGVRISVMSRHTLDDGKTEDVRIRGQYDEWLKELAPSLEDLGDFYVRHVIDRNELLRRYRESLQGKRPVLLHLAYRAQREDVTILCKEESPEECHRMIIAVEAKLLLPSLEIIVR